MPKTISMVAEITQTDPLRREANTGLMVDWINANLLDRASHDVRKSIVLYDENLLFIMALPEGITLTEGQRRELFDKTPVRFWSKGVV